MALTRALNLKHLYPVAGNNHSLKTEKILKLNNIEKINLMNKFQHLKTIDIIKSDCLFSNEIWEMNEYFTVMIPTIFNWIPVAHTLIPWTIHKSILAIHGMILLPYNVYQGINIQYSLIHYKGGHKYVQKNCREAHYGIAC